MLYLIRHGTTTLNSPGLDQKIDERIRGWLEVPLDDNGHNQAIRAGEALKEYNIEILYTSTLLRAEQTCKEISGVLNLSYIPKFELRPWNLGDLNGELVSVAIPVMQKYFENKEDKLPGGESYLNFYNRWKSLLFDLIKQSIDKNIAAVTHSRNLYCLNHILTNGVAPIVFTGVPIPGGIIEINAQSLSTTIIH